MTSTPLILYGSTHNLCVITEVEPDQTKRPKAEIALGANAAAQHQAYDFADPTYNAAVLQVINGKDAATVIAHFKKTVVVAFTADQVNACVATAKAL
jgi:hypothetical protein